MSTLRGLPERLVFVRADWMERGLCRGLSPKFFFPDRAIAGRSQRDANPIRRFCAACQVRTECLEYAQQNRIPYGWFGGMSPKERLCGRRH